MVAAAIVALIVLALVRPRAQPALPVPTCSATYSVAGSDLDVSVASRMPGGAGGQVGVRVVYPGGGVQARSVNVGPGKHLTSFRMSEAPGAEVNGVVANRSRVGFCTGFEEAVPPSTP